MNTTNNLNVTNVLVIDAGADSVIEKKKKETKRARVFKLLDSAMSHLEIMDVESISLSSYYQYKSQWNKARGVSDARLHKTITNQNPSKNLVMLKPVFSEKALENATFVTINGVKGMISNFNDEKLEYYVSENGSAVYKTITAIDYALGKYDVKLLMI